MAVRGKAAVIWTAAVGCGLIVLVLLTFRGPLGSIQGQERPDPLAASFRGVTTDGTVEDGLFPIHATGVSTAPIREAALAFLGSLTEDQRGITTYPVDDIEWRQWNNVHRYDRQGVSFADMRDGQREMAFGLLRAGLSAKGLQEAEGIMRLNGYLADVLNRPEEYGEWLYHLTVMGEPSDTEPWGWQLDGHHLIINYFILGDQVVMTPTFMGSEPVSAETGRFAASVVLQEKQNRGLALMAALDDEQKVLARIGEEKTGNNAVAQAFQDNLVLDYAGLRADAMRTGQRELLMKVVDAYIGDMEPGHAAIRMEEIRDHLDETYFAWIGEADQDAVFYYRVHSPVILIEFDHELPVALPGPRVPGRAHIHTVVRTPNGNDYGKDLLRQHYEAHRDDPNHGHPFTPVPSILKGKQ